MQINKYKKLMSDTVLFSVSNFGSKILVFLLVPLYTNVLTTAEYGIVDLILSLSNLMIHVATFCISEAVLRFALDKTVKKNQVLSVALLLIYASTFIMLFGRGVCVAFNKELAEYWGYFVAIYFLIALNGVLNGYTRGLDKTKLFAYSGLVYTIALIVLNILFLLVFKWGIVGYLMAMILTEVASILFKIIGGHFLKDMLSFSLNKELGKEMIKYSLPIVPSSTAWWIMQVSDKYLVAAFAGIAANGIYSVAYKIPTILSTLTTIFTQAWQISAIKSYGDSDNDNFVSNVYKYFMIASVLISSVLIILSKHLGYILYAKDFFVAWTYVPILLVAFHFSGLSGVIASVYSATKKTMQLFLSTSVGAVINIVLNLLFIPKYGAIAAAYTTLASFFATWIVRIVYARKLIEMKINYVVWFGSFALLILEAVLVSIQVRYAFVWAIVITAIQIVLFLPEIKFMVEKMLVAAKKIIKKENR